MAFDDTQFPINISRGARGGPRRRTQIVSLANGREERNASWKHSRRSYDVSFGVRTADDLALVRAFWEARMGQEYGFRFKDWADYKSCAPSAVPANTDQALGTGNAAQTAFQLVKDYTSGPRTYTRPITHPVAASVTIALNGVDQPTGWTVDLLTGIVTFAVAPGIGIAVTAGFQFDVPVRFDSDMLDTTLNFERNGSISSVLLVELKQ